MALSNTPGYDIVVQHVSGVKADTYLSGMIAIMSKINNQYLVPAGPIEILSNGGLKQADITKAEGTKQAAILQAEGQAEAVKKKADAEKYRQIAVAEGEAKAILNVFSAIHEGRPDNELITLKYLEMLPKLADGPANKVFLPYEASGIISSLAAMVEGIKENKKESAPAG